MILFWFFSPPIYCDRFSIDRTTDQEMIFHIDPDLGAITLGKILDRETAGWHNITVKAVEAGTLLCILKRVCHTWDLSVVIVDTTALLRPFQN